MKGRIKGSLIERSPGHWAIILDHKDPLTGKRRQKWHSFEGDEQAARDKHLELYAAMKGGHAIAPAKITLNEFLDDWERDWLAVSVSPKTAERYVELLRKHVRPHIGHVKLQQLKHTRLGALYSKLQIDGRGPGHGLHPRTCRHVHAVVRLALGYAVANKKVVENVAKLMKPPKVDDAETQIPDAQDVKRVLEAVRGRNLFPIAVVALGTGMRRGEMCGLRWRDVDLTRATLRVERSVEQTNRGLRIKPPKTTHGRRTITLPPSTVAALEAHWIEQQEQRLALGLGKAPRDGYVFAKFDGTVRSPDNLTKEWATAMREAELSRVTLHSLRHAHASALIADGCDVLTVSRRLGHGSAAITLKVYSHLFGGTDTGAAAAAERAFGTK